MSFGIPAHAPIWRGHAPCCGRLSAASGPAPRPTPSAKLPIPPPAGPAPLRAPPHSLREAPIPPLCRPRPTPSAGLPIPPPQAPPLCRPRPPQAPPRPRAPSARPSASPRPAYRRCHLSLPRSSLVARGAPSDACLFRCPRGRQELASRRREAHWGRLAANPRPRLWVEGRRPASLTGVVVLKAKVKRHGGVEAPCSPLVGPAAVPGSWDLSPRALRPAPRMGDPWRPRSPPAALGCRGRPRQSSPCWGPPWLGVQACVSLFSPPNKGCRLPGRGSPECLGGSPGSCHCCLGIVRRLGGRSPQNPALFQNGLIG